MQETRRPEQRQEDNRSFSLLNVQQNNSLFSLSDRIRYTL